ncbi:putative short-subunit dehydrogenase-like oxidoreductase (DUF2520 family) [Gillisia sp. Hel_I_86]|uniref:Rossmann-like and DUF2520 domain-containing protein n=1 Tax=Gillisia sp. Hel_I_86 TaxID=1249981 RepID=UPI00119C30F1|nr:Rossmann-like and DUF2520 domain-containing protein [Gillisia sp. Hel_I_86]TVZ27771.1 putative short-subunit dehydrogenase-like oxidoreductase (DUF2520 family) [Gillisia sp. Hel_I_86]
MKRIVLFGTGNVATHLFEAYNNSANYKIIQVYNHASTSLQHFKDEVEITTDLDEITPADIYILALKDDILAKVSQKMKETDALVLHTAGAVSIEVLNKFKNHGVFYPLQTFSKHKKVNFTKIPICIETNTIANTIILKELASEISGKVFEISSEQRKSLHVAAVFVSNFVNFLYTEGEKICNNNQVPFEILHPLILETASKAINMGPKDAQTGPAKREDQEVINSHLEFLNEEQQNIYSLLTLSIQNLHGKEL